MKIAGENKGIIVSGIILVILSGCFTTVINQVCGYRYSVSIIRVIIYVVASVGAFLFSYKYCRNFVLNYGTIFVPLGITLYCFIDAQGCVSFLGYRIEIATLTTTFVILGLAIYFYRYCLKLVVHTIIFWITVFLFLLVAQRGYLTVVLLVMMGLILLCSKKNNVINSPIFKINIFFYIFLALRMLNITIKSIINLKNLFYDDSYMAVIARRTLLKAKYFGSVSEPWLFGGNDKYYMLLRVFGLFGVVAGAVAFIVLTIFVFSICRKCLKNKWTDTTPIACATVSIIHVRFFISILANCGIVLDGILAPIPILSDGIFGYIAIFILIGLLLSKSKRRKEIETVKKQRFTDMCY